MLIAAAVLLGEAAVILAEPVASQAVTATEARSLALKDVKGKTFQPLTDSGQKATLLFFILHDCPLANRLAPEMTRIVAEYQGRGIRSYLVYVGNDLPARTARRHAQQYGFKCPVLLDDELKLMRFARATISPEAVVFSPDNRPLYRGRIDDRLTDFGKLRVEPTRRDLREALEAILSGQPVPTPVTKAIGCYLPSGDEAASKNGH